MKEIHCHIWIVILSWQLKKALFGAELSCFIEEVYIVIFAQILCIICGFSLVSFPSSFSAVATPRVGVPVRQAPFVTPKAANTLARAAILASAKRAAVLHKTPTKAPIP